MPGAGMLGWSLRHRGEELLGHPVSLSKYLETGEPTGRRAAAPLGPTASPGPATRSPAAASSFDLSAPNVHTDRDGLPIHGLVAGSRRWEVLEEQASS